MILQGLIQDSVQDLSKFLFGYDFKSSLQDFNKIHCFCFEDQIIPGHQQVDLPVQFFIDPMLAKDPQLKDLDTITLSYTFFHAKDSNILEILGLPSPKKSQ